MNNMRRGRIKNSSQKDLHSLCEAGNPPTNLLLGDDLPKKIREAKELSKLISHPYLNHHDTQDIFVSGNQTQSTISPTIPKQQTIQELTNIVNNKALRHTVY